MSALGITIEKKVFWPIIQKIIANAVTKAECPVIDRGAHHDLCFCLLWYI